MEKLIKKYQNIKIVKLDINYRSQKNIIDAANNLIKFNRKNQIPKNMKAIRNDNEKIQLIECNDKDEEANKVIAIIKNFIQEEKCTY